MSTGPAGGSQGYRRSALSPAMKCEDSMSPRSGASKAVSINEFPEEISPMILGKQRDFSTLDQLDLDRSSQPTREHRASMSKKRLSGRPSIERMGSRGSYDDSPISGILAGSAGTLTSAHPPEMVETLVGEVEKWIKREKARRATRKGNAPLTPPTQLDEEAAAGGRRGSDASEGSVALENLETIVEQTLSLASQRQTKSRRSPAIRPRSSTSSIKKLRRQSTYASSGTQYEDGEIRVPTCEEVLDNTKTLSYSGGAPEGVDEAPSQDHYGRRRSSVRQSTREREAWAKFKFEIVRLTHTLRLKGWRRVPMERSSEIDVERLSGALTNSIYVVSPPKDLPAPTPAEETDIVPRPKNPPPKLLLRIYGPQVEHLIDREMELAILRRLAKKKIGPRLLGTFANGRFEEFFYARPLTPKDLRVPDTSKQIAKRMRELHEGIELLPEERNAGPFVWQNWEKWVDRCEKVISWIDDQIVNKKPLKCPGEEVWRQRGLVCGTQWGFFRQTVEKYRKWLEEQYGGLDKVKDNMVFAHNDTQYGNILRMVPPGDSPLLLPANEHKRLVVIDFEYANANLPGLEFANHFTEWCYNYHDETTSWACNTNRYPNLEEQHRFIKAYIKHHPTFIPMPKTETPLQTPSMTPIVPSVRPLTSSISDLRLDGRAPVEQSNGEVSEEEKTQEAEVQRLLAETRLWRLANSAQWVAWGIVQAKVPGMLEEEQQVNVQINGEEPRIEPGSGTDPLTPENAKLADAIDAKRPDDAEVEIDEEEGEEEFDYLAYAQDRAMFFWGDALRLGIVKMDDLPEDFKTRVRVLDY